jgi:hypothetical protein
VEEKTMNDKLNSAWWALRIGLGLGAFLAGLDKFFGYLADWGMYLSPAVEGLLPVSGAVFMKVVGVIEMAAGAALLAGVTRLGGYVVMGWLLAISANLLTTGLFFDLAVRDVEIAIAAYTLARLTEARQAAGVAAPARSAAGLVGRVAAFVAAALLGASASAAAAETWTKVPVVDSHCVSKVKSAPDAHTRECALQCHKGGYGLLDADGRYLKFDAAGNEKALAALKASTKTDHLRATITGERDGETIRVSSITIE